VKNRRRERPSPAAPPALEGAVPSEAPPGRPLFAVLRAVLGVALVLSLATALAIGGKRYVRTSPRFAVAEISVTGSRRTADTIARIANLQKGSNVFTTDLDAARARLMQDPWIVDAKLARRLPDAIYVHVTEREAAGIVAIGETYLVSRDGEIIKRLEVEEPVDLPIVTGLDVGRYAEDREGTRIWIKRALDLASDYERGPLGKRAPLEEVHLSADGSVEIVVGKGGTVLALGAPPFRRKLDQAARVLAELDRRGAKADALMLDNEVRPDRVVVRLR
jgi:cell division protein FtsQ